MAYDLKDKRVFLSGPMTGLPSYNVTEFALAHSRCKLAGARTVYDPAQVWLSEPQSVSERKDHAQCMRECLRELTRPTACRAETYDVLVQLEGWQQSEGARCEAVAATALDMDVVPVSEIEVPAELMPIFEGTQGDGKLPEDEPTRNDRDVE